MSCPPWHHDIKGRKRSIFLQRNRQEMDINEGAPQPSSLGQSGLGMGSPDLPQKIRRGATSRFVPAATDRRGPPPSRAPDRGCARRKPDATPFPSFDVTIPQPHGQAGPGEACRRAPGASRAGS